MGVPTQTEIRFSLLYTLAAFGGNAGKRIYSNGLSSTCLSVSPALLSTHADRQGVDISVTVCFFV